MTYNNNAKKEMVGASCTSGMSVLGVGCVARVAAPHLGLSRVRLSVTEPRCCCFPGLGKRREVATFSFREEDWTEVLDGQYENTAAYCLVNLARLQHLEEDLPVKVKWWVGRRKGKTRLTDTLGDVLRLLCSRPHVTLQVVASSEQVSVSWVAPLPAFHTYKNKATGRILTLPAHEQLDEDWVFPGAWTSRDDQLDEEDLELLSALEGAFSLPDTRKYHTYINNATGRILKLPAHEQLNEDWAFPGAWTSRDDQLNEEDLELVRAL